MPLASVERVLITNDRIEQTFGVDLEARARADRKRVPIIITTILTFLDNRKLNLSLPICEELIFARLS